MIYDEIREITNIFNEGTKLEFYAGDTWFDVLYFEDNTVFVSFNDEPLLPFELEVPNISFNNFREV